MKNAGELVQVERLSDNRLDQRSVQCRVIAFRKRSHDDHDRPLVLLIAEATDHAHAVESRHHEIKKNDRIFRHLHLIQCIETVGCDAAPQSEALQSHFHHRPDRFVVIDDQNVFLRLRTHLRAEQSQTEPSDRSKWLSLLFLRYIERKDSCSLTGAERGVISRGSTHHAKEVLGRGVWMRRSPFHGANTGSTRCNGHHSMRLKLRERLFQMAGQGVEAFYDLLHPRDVGEGLTRFGLGYLSLATSNPITTDPIGRPASDTGTPI